MLKVIKANDGYLITDSESGFEKLYSVKTNLIDLNSVDSLEELSVYAIYTWGVEHVNLTGLDVRAIKETFIQMQRVFDDFPFIKGTLKSVLHKDMQYMMSFLPVDSMTKGEIYFNSIHYKDISRIEKIYETETLIGGAPVGTKFQHAGIHEMGHLVMLAILNNLHSDSNVVEEHWLTNIETSKIVDEAYDALFNDVTSVEKLREFVENSEGMTSAEVAIIFKKFGRVAGKAMLVAEISSYATEDAHEAIAESFSDVYGNNDLIVSFGQVIGEAFLDFYSNSINSCVLSKHILQVVNERSR